MDASGAVNVVVTGAGGVGVRWVECSSEGGLEERSCLSADRLPATKGVAPVPPDGRPFSEPPVASPLILSTRLPDNRRRKGHVPRKRTPHTQGPPTPPAPVTTTFTAPEASIF